MRLSQAVIPMLLALLFAAPQVLRAEDEASGDATAYPLAVLPFQERGDDVAGLGGKVTDLLYAYLLTQPELFLVDRQDLANTLAEQQLNISGTVSADTAAKVGQLTGAKILVTGSVMQAGNKTVLVAKVIGTETSRVIGASVRGADSDDLTDLTDQLGEQVNKTIVDKADQLVAKAVSNTDRLAKVKKELGEATRPSVQVTVTERHIGRPAIDPAAETELTLFCKESGFTVLDAKRSTDPADVLIEGEGFSEFAGRLGSLTSVKARLEVKAIDRKTGKVLATDRQTEVVVDLSEQVAGKTALQQAAAVIAERMLPKLVTAGK